MLTKKFAVLGSPIAHSKSPLLHTAAYNYLGIGGSYSREEVLMGGLSNFLGTHQREYDGFSITMPLKEEAYACADVHDEIATRVRVANTLILKDDFVIASNTDVLGFKEIFKKLESSVLHSPTILGSGSTAKSAVLALTLLGVPSLQMIARNESAVRDIQRLFTEVKISFRPWGGVVADASLVVSAVPEVQGITFDHTVSQFVDVNYKDEVPGILNSIQANSYTYMNGLHLLVYQAAFQVLRMRSIDDERFDEIVKVMFAALEPLN